MNVDEANAEGRHIAELIVRRYAEDAELWTMLFPMFYPPPVGSAEERQCIDAALGWFQEWIDEQLEGWRLEDSFTLATVRAMHASSGQPSVGRRRPKS